MKVRLCSLFTYSSPTPSFYSYPFSPEQAQSRSSSDWGLGMGPGVVGRGEHTGPQQG